MRMENCRLLSKAYEIFLCRFRPLNKLVNDNTDGFLKISQLYYALGEGEDSLR